MFNLLRNKIKYVAFFAILSLPSLSNAQEINPLYDRQPIRFGYAIMGNSAKLKYTLAKDYLLQDTVTNINSINFPGFGIGGLVNFRLSTNWDLRAMLNVQFAQRNMEYEFKKGEKRKLEIESTYMEIPVALKFKSKRHNNIRMYGIGGLTYRYDFTSDIDTDRSNSDPILAIKPSTLSYDVGVGLDLYFEFFKFSPEIKISNGIGNQKVEDPYLYASSIHRVSPKMVVFSLIFQ